MIKANRFFFLFSGVALLWISACSEGPVVEAPVAERAVEVAVQTVTLQRQSIQPSLQVVGVVQSSDKIELSADVSAPVAKILVKEGQRVKQGQVLIELDAEKLQLEVRRAAETLKQAESRLREAQTALQRREQLAKQQTLSQEVLDSARHDFSRSEAVVEEARAALRLADRGLRDAQVTSPVDAVIDKQLVDIGESVRPGSELLVIQATAALEVETYVSERDINTLSEGNEAIVIIDDWQPRRYSAVVQSRGAAANPRTGNFPVTLLMGDVDERVRPGMTAQLEIQTNPVSDVLLLPESALADRQRQRVVFINDNGVAVMRRPVLKAGFSDRLLVLSGLDVGEQVIVSPLDRIVDGVAVKTAQP